MMLRVVAVVWALFFGSCFSALAQTDRLAERRAHLEMLASDDPLTVEFAIEEGFMSGDQVIIRETLRTAFSSESDDLKAQALVYVFNSGQILFLELAPGSASPSVNRRQTISLPAKLSLSPGKQAVLSGAILNFETNYVINQLQCRFTNGGVKCVGPDVQIQLEAADMDSLFGHLIISDEEVAVTADLY